MRPHLVIAGLDHRSGQPASQQRVLAVVLKVSTAQRAAFDLYPRAQHNINAQRAGLTAQCHADATNEIRIPGRGKSYGRWKARGRKAAAQSEVIGVVVVLDAQAVRAVRDTDAREPKAWNLMGAPIVGASSKERLVAQWGLEHGDLR